MSRKGYIETFRRIVTLLLITVGLIAVGYWGTLPGVMLIAAGFAVYILLPRERVPEKALTFERIPAVIGPDMLGFLMSSVFIALPFWAGMGEEYLWGLVHPSAVLSWPIALISLSFLVIAAKYACYWVLIKPDGLSMSTMSGRNFVPYGEIKQIAPYRRGLPKWMKWLTPLLVMSGKYTAAGAITLARDTTGLSLELKDGSSVVIEQEGFEKPFDRIVKALKKNELPFLEDD